MEPPSEAAADPTAHTFSQVVFIDIPHSYPPSTPVTCRYSLTTAYQPHPRDWVGVFKVGWSTAKDYHTFVWVEPCLDVVGQESQIKQAVFREYYLPKDEIEFYQFCYIDSTGQVRGASTPFCFKNPEEQSTESTADDDLLVITTQEQVEQGVREKAELQKELDQIRQENETLKSALQKQQQDAASLKDEEREKENGRLLGELAQAEEQNENLKSVVEQQRLEIDCLKEELLVQKTKEMEIQQQSAAELKKSFSLDGANEAHAQQKYSQAVMKINQLKDERKELTGRVDVQNEEISKLNCKLREGERELFKAKDSIQLLQVDLQSSEKEKERLSAELQRLQSVAHNVDEVRRENQELRRSLSQQEIQEDCPEDDLRVQCQTLGNRLRETEAKLAAEREESRNSKRKTEFLEGEVLQIREQLENVNKLFDQEQRKSSKIELQLKEALEAIADKDVIIEDKEHLMMLVRHEREELSRENQKLNSDIEDLRTIYSDLHAAPPADSPRAQPDTNPPAGDTSAGQPDSPGEENLYENIESIAEPEEELLVCRHCQESFPGITRHELEQHEQSHRVCPFCTMICDNMEQSVFEDHVYGHEL